MKVTETTDYDRWLRRQWRKDGFGPIGLRPVDFVFYVANTAFWFAVWASLK